MASSYHSQLQPKPTANSTVINLGRPSRPILDFSKCVLMWRLVLAAAVTALCHHSAREPAQVLLPFCTEHNLRTCCAKSVALQAYARLQKAVSESLAFHRDDNLTRFSLSERCLEVTQTVFCTDCDGDVGENLLSGICPSLCENWYSACQNDLFQPGLTAGHLELCSSKSLVCAQLQHSKPSAKAFCEGMGYAVRKNQCYTGIPAAILRGAAYIKAEEETKEWGWELATVVALAGIALFLTLQGRLRRAGVDIREARLKAFQQANTEASPSLSR